MSVLVAAASPTGAAREVPEQLEFTEPPPGLRGLRRFVLTALDDAGYLFALRSTDEPGVRLFVVPPRAYFPEYEPDLAPATGAVVGASSGDVTLLVVVHPGEGGEPPTANLLAPVVVNAATGAAVQVVLDDGRWPLRAALRADGTAA